LKVSRRQFLAATLFTVAVQAHAAAPGAEPFTNFNVVLLQSSKVLEERVASIDAMAEYIKAIEAAAKEAVAASAVRQADSADQAGVGAACRKRAWRLGQPCRMTWQPVETAVVGPGVIRRRRRS
jgi:hypothetical protein